MMKIEKQEIHLWCVFEKGIQDEDQLNAYLALLSNDEIAFISKNTAINIY
jgi:hypothetical protein